MDPHIQYTLKYSVSARKGILYRNLFTVLLLPSVSRRMARAGFPGLKNSRYRTCLTLLIAPTSGLLHVLLECTIVKTQRPLVE